MIGTYLSILTYLIIDNSNEMEVYLTVVYSLGLLITQQFSILFITKSKVAFLKTQKRTKFIWVTKNTRVFLCRQAKFFFSTISNFTKR